MSTLVPESIERRSPTDWPSPEEATYASAQAALADHYDLETHSLRIDTDSAGQIHVLAAGNPDGEPVVCCHGLGTTAASWIPMLPALTDEFRVYAPDRPGRGLSAASTYRDKTLRWFMTAYLVETIDALDLGDPHLVGNSLGGGQGFLLAIDHDRVDRLCLVGGPAGVSKDVPLPFRLMTVKGLNRALQWLMSRGDSIENANEAMARFNVENDSAIPDEFYEVMAANEALPGRKKSLRSLQHKQGSFLRLHETFDIREEIVRIDRPTSFVWGSEDAFFEPAIGRELADRMPDAEFHELAGHGHTPWLEPTDEVERRVQAFLSD